MGSVSKVNKICKLKTMYKNVRFGKSYLCSIKVLMTYKKADAAVCQKREYIPIKIGGIIMAGTNNNNYDQNKSNNYQNAQNSQNSQGSNSTNNSNSENNQKNCKNSTNNNNNK